MLMLEGTPFKGRKKKNQGVPTWCFGVFHSFHTSKEDGHFHSFFFIIISEAMSSGADMTFQSIYKELVVRPLFKIDILSVQDVLTGLTGPISGSRYTCSIYYSQWVCPTCVARDMKNRLLQTSTSSLYATFTTKCLTITTFPKSWKKTTNWQSLV